MTRAPWRSTTPHSDRGVIGASDHRHVVGHGDQLDDVDVGVIPNLDTEYQVVGVARVGSLPPRSRLS
jgi:hypothetical protein